jgi:hypothetical protein
MGNAKPSFLTSVSDGRLESMTRYWEVLFLRVNYPSFLRAEYDLNWDVLLQSPIETAVVSRAAYIRDKLSPSSPTRFDSMGDTRGVEKGHATTSIATQSIVS